MIMKKLAIAMMLSVSALAASAQVNYKVQTACHPQDVKHYDTERLRGEQRYAFGKGSCESGIRLAPS